MTATQLQLQQHPLSAAYPKMEAKEFDALVQDITAHGQLNDCVTLDGMVLDGWTRYRACLTAGIECRFVEYDGTDPRAYVESVNGHRRHLAYWQRSEAKRAVAAVLECASWSARGRPKQLGNVAELNGARAPITNRQLAENLGTSVDAIKRAKRAVRAGHGEAVSAGKITANQAAKQAKPSTVNKPQRGQESTAELHAENEELKGHMRALATALRWRPTAQEWQPPPTPWDIAEIRDWCAEVVNAMEVHKAQSQTGILGRFMSLSEMNLARQHAAMDNERDGQKAAYFAEGARC